jgi:hypothetical protein
MAEKIVLETLKFPQSRYVVLLSHYPPRWSVTDALGVTRDIHRIIKLMSCNAYNIVNLQNSKGHLSLNKDALAHWRDILGLLDRRPVNLKATYIVRGSGFMQRLSKILNFFAANPVNHQLYHVESVEEALQAIAAKEKLIKKTNTDEPC